SNVYPIQCRGVELEMQAIKPLIKLEEKIADLVPRLFDIIPKKSLTEGRWIADITGSLSLHLWNLISDFDIAANGTYSAKAAYDRLFISSETLDHILVSCVFASLSGKGGTT
ncbi:hypothetical protein ACJX0J_019807, partial [Zea mays]